MVQPPSKVTGGKAHVLESKAVIFGVDFTGPQILVVMIH